MSNSRKPRSSNLVFPSGMNKTPQVIAGFFVLSCNCAAPPPPRLSERGWEVERLSSTGMRQVLDGKRVAGPERHVEEATLSASGPTALRDSGVAADLRWAVGNCGPWYFSQDRLKMTLIPTRSKAKRIRHNRASNSLLIITNNPNADDFSQLALRGVEDDAVTALALGPVEGHVRPLDQALRRVDQVFADRHAHRHGN
jgi:hypothetical protein